jgi:hypothetical protein
MSMHCLMLCDRDASRIALGRRARGKRMVTIPPRAWGHLPSPRHRGVRAQAKSKAGRSVTAGINSPNRFRIPCPPNPHPNSLPLTYGLNRVTVASDTTRGTDPAEQNQIRQRKRVVRGSKQLIFCQLFLRPPDPSNAKCARERLIEFYGRFLRSCDFLAAKARNSA